MKNTYLHHGDKTAYSKVSVEAVNWLMQLESGPMDTESRKLFETWLKESPENKEMFDQVRYLWNTTGTLKDHPFTTNVIQRSLAKERRTALKSKWIARLHFQLPGISPFAVAVSILLVIAGVWFTQMQLPEKTTYQAATGIQRYIDLSDGSIVRLDSESVVTTIFSRDIRRIELKEGRALFSVAHNPDRPFVVTAGNIDIRALGTVFAVDKRK